MPFIAVPPLEMTPAASSVRVPLLALDSVGTCIEHFRMECATPSALSSQALPLFCSGLRRSPLAGQPKWVAPKKNYSRKRHAFVHAQLDLKPPPYSLDALEPHMSRQTLEYHWGKHHRAYVDNVNKQIAGTELDGMSLEEIIISTYNKGDPLPSFNNAAQAWNHNFFWESMKPGGGGLPAGTLLELIERDFGSFDAFLQEFKAAATTQFGSGWAWLSYKANRLAVGNAVNPRPTEKDNKLVISKSPNAVNPLVWDYSPLLTIDVWEHAYYLDYEYKRQEYVSTFMEHLVSWESVSARLQTAKAKAEEQARVEEERKRKEETDELENSEPMEMYMDSEPEGSDSE